MFITKLESRINFLSWVSFIFDLGRTLPHSVLTIFLLSKGISISNVLLFQLAFMLPIFILEIPSGFIADKYGRKLIYLLSLLLMISGFAAIGFSDVMWLIFIGQALYGAATALMSGTIDADLIFLIKQNDKTLLKKAQWKLEMSSIIGALIGGISGSFIYSSFQEIFYIFPITLFIIVLILVWSSWEKVETNFRNIPLRSYYKHFKDDSKNFFTSKIVAISIIVVFASQLFIQPFYNFWQQIYHDKQIPTKYFGLIYGLFQLFTLIGTILFAKTKELNKWIHFAALAFAFGTVVAALLFLRSFAFALIFPIFLISHNMYMNRNSYILNKEMSENHISSQTSILSTWTRLFSVMSLLVSYALLKVFSVESIFYIIVPIMLFTLLLITITQRRNYEKMNT